jgi:hypothetical protein
LPEDATEVSRCSQRLDDDLQSPIAAPLLRAFYSPNGNYAGHSFLGPPPLVEDNDITEADLLAVTMLEVRFRPRAVRRLLDDGSEKHMAMLRALTDTPKGLPITKASNDQLEAAYSFRRAAYSLTGRQQEVAVQKLCARKRPHLVPILDRVIKDWLALEIGGYWKTIRSLLNDDDRLQQLRLLAQEAERLGAPDVTRVPDLRLFDSLIWMFHSEGARPTRERLQN